MGRVKPGDRITCPKCRQTGLVVEREFKKRVGVRTYSYTWLAVMHKVGGQTRYCLLQRVRSARTEEVKESVRTEEVKEVQELRKRVEELERENAQLRARLAEIEQSVIAKAGEEERAALYALYVKKRGYTPEQAEIAKTIMHALVAEDWVAVRAAVFA